MKVPLINNEYELSKFIFLNYIHENPKYQSIESKQISQISNSLLSIWSDYDYLVFEEDNLPIDLEAFVIASIEFLLEKGVTEETQLPLKIKLETIMKKLGVPRIKNSQDYETLIERIIKNLLKIEQIKRLSPSEIETFKRTLIDYFDTHGRIDKNDVCYLYSELIKNKSNIVLNTSAPRTMIEPEKQQQGISPEINQFFSQKDFTILEELGRNSYAGRVTSKARHNQTGKIVVIKQFQFLSANWDGYKLVQKEIETLSQLDHPNIPKYLGQYEDEQGFCLVQEYIDAPSLASFGQLPIAEVTEIALSVLG
ncbi:MAG: protein kinase, partial [Xenococcus sp. (in: cyanobacteria)]